MIVLSKLADKFEKLRTSKDHYQFGHTIKPGTLEHGTTEHGRPAEQRSTPEQWRNNLKLPETSEHPQNPNRIPT